MKSFTQKVYAVVAKIPKGQVLTYKEVAKRAGSPKAFRSVGNILRKNCSPKIPCYRVIRSDGKAGGYKGIMNNKEKVKILRKEGVRIN